MTAFIIWGIVVAGIVYIVPGVVRMMPWPLHLAIVVCALVAGITALVLSFEKAKSARYGLTVLPPDD